MSKSKTVQCGGCGEEGHNKRTCPTRTGPVEAEEATTAVAEAPVVTSDPTPTPAAPVVEEAEVEEETPPPAPKKKERIPLPPRPRREAPTGDRGTAATAAPFRCPKCNSVAILAIVKVRDYAESMTQKKDVWKGDQRCENCLNRPDPAVTILKWGIKPGETVTAAQANA